MGKVQRTLKALISKQFAAELKAAQAPHKWHDTHMGWGLSGASLALVLSGVGFIVPTIIAGRILLAAGGAIWFLALMVMFRDAAPRARWMWSRGLSIPAIAGLTYLWCYQYPVVIVKPDVPFALSESRSVETSLYVNNRADEPAYSVLMQVKILTARVSSDTLRVDIADDKIIAHANPFNNATAIADVRICLGADANGAESAFVLFPTIPPHVTYAVTVAGVPPKTMAIAHIMTFSLEPHGYVSGSAFQDCGQLLPPSEKITVRWTFFKILGRKQPPTQQ
jgi:hypothetical protein